MKIQHLHFSGKIFGLLTGFGAMAGSWGVILAGPPFTGLIASLGWRHSLGVITLLTLGLLALSILFVRDVPGNKNRDGPEITLGETFQKTKKVLLHRG
jgi:MFS family permease